uniref:Uncharacterized protein n=1 Tax=Salix viminalis TaxID=40686 RepID=A0A6N2JYZ6_SALVM
MHVFFSIEVLRMALYLMMLHGISWFTISVNKVTQSVRPSPMLSFCDRKVPSVLGRWNLFWPSELFFMKVAMTGFVLCLLVGFLDWIPVKEIGANLSQELLSIYMDSCLGCFSRISTFLVTPDEILGTKAMKCQGIVMH